MDEQKPVGFNTMKIGDHFRWTSSPVHRSYQKTDQRAYCRLRNNVRDGPDIPLATAGAWVVPLRIWTQVTPAE